MSIEWTSRNNTEPETIYQLTFLYDPKIYNIPQLKTNGKVCIYL